VPRKGEPTTLADLGIHLRWHTPGEHRAACPECARQKSRPGDDALAVKVEPSGAVAWCCHRCGKFKGRLPAPGEAFTIPRRSPGPARLRALKAAPEPFRPTPSAEQYSPLAQNVWRQTEDIWPGTPEPWRYLRERRGIGRWNHDRLRWHPRCPWRDRRGAPLQHAGCIIAPVNAQLGGLVIGVWRIRPFLEGKVPRKGLGPTKGCASRLFPASGPLLAVTEGIEDALACHELSGVPTWAALNAGNLVELVLPARFTDVHVVADADDVGMERAREAVLRFRRKGRQASLIRPVATKDANDVLRARRAAG
jgi:hypothetical protein